MGRHDDRMTPDPPDMPPDDIGAGSVLVVDAANVMGSRPDGWWRDRAGAAGRLVEEVRAWAPPDGDVVVVLEGAARRGCVAGRAGRVRVVHAAGSGDDAIVALVVELVAELVAERAGDVRSEDAVTVVTSDRGLRDRVRAAGGLTQGARWLRERLDDAARRRSPTDRGGPRPE